MPSVAGATPTIAHPAGVCDATQCDISTGEIIFRRPVRSRVSSATAWTLLLTDFLQKAGKRLGALGAEFEADRGRLDGLRQRLQEERCHLAVLGQFKRGKSTLVNCAAWRSPVLPTAIVPLTSIPTFLHGGEQIAARVLFDNDKAEERFSGPDAEAMAEFLRAVRHRKRQPSQSAGRPSGRSHLSRASAGKRLVANRHAGHWLNFSPQYRGDGQFPAAMRCGDFCGLGGPADHRGRGGVSQACASQTGPPVLHSEQGGLSRRGRTP